MGFGTSLFLLAAGAVLTFAVEVDSSEGININTVGIILMIVGVIGMIASIIYWGSWGGFGTYRGSGGYRRRRVYEEDV